MKFLVDAQLPARFADWLREAGHDARHTLNLPLGNRTTDHDIIDIAAREQRALITKDMRVVEKIPVQNLASGLRLDTPAMRVPGIIIMARDVVVSGFSGAQILLG